MKHANSLAIGLSLALCVAGTAVAQDARTSADAMTAPQVQATLEAQGYTKINDVEFEDGVWKADARSADGQRVELRIDPANGTVYPEDKVAGLSEADVRAKLSAAGYAKVHDVEFDNGMWTAEADDANGKSVDLTLDPDTGRVVGKARD
ncbi:MULTISPECIES: PepSY domain-containing protein [unclassified Luteimonas]